jgi:hypothetical protein
MSAESETTRQVELREHIAATREELGQTLEALAAKTNITARAEDAPRDAASRLKIGLLSLPIGLASLPIRVATGIVTLWRRGYSSYTKVPPNRRRLSIAAVLSGGVTALLAVTRPWAAVGSRSRGRCR